MATDMIDGNAAPGASDWMDALLAAEGQADYIDDAGFTASIMQQLPAPTEQSPAWRRPAVVALWGLATLLAFFALPGVLHDITRNVYVLYTAQPLSLPMMVTLIVAIGAAMWMAAAYTMRVR